MIRYGEKIIEEKKEDLFECLRCLVLLFAFDQNASEKYELINLKTKNEERITRS